MRIATEFRIDRFMDEATLAGRICLGDLHKGHHFTSIVRRVFSGPIDSLSCELSLISPTDLEIIQIEAYGRIHEHWLCGMTAGIRLYGSDISSLRDLVLHAPERTHYSIVSETAHS